MDGAAGKRQSGTGTSEPWRERLGTRLHRHLIRHGLIWFGLAVALALAAFALTHDHFLESAVLFAGAGLAGWAIGRLSWPGRRLFARGLGPRPDPAASDPDRTAMIDAVLKQLPDPILLLDSNARVRLANQATHHLLRAVAPGKHIASLMRTPSVLDAIERVRKGGVAQTVEYTVLVPFERHLQAYVTPAPWLEEHRPSQTIPVLIVVHDLTAMKRLEQMRADFVASASHELRTPLSSLAGFIETLRGHARDDHEAQDRFLQIMEEQAARMGRLINDLLSLSRIELNEHVPPSQEVKIKSVIEDVIDAFMPMAREENVEIKLLGACDTPVIGQRDELVQLFQNLVDNALKYGAEGGRVEISLSTCKSAPQGHSEQRTVCVTVRDFGPGIPREHIPRLTERFYRVDVRRSRRRGGTGLGLAIVKHIINRHRGWLDIKSTPGDGSAFTVGLPCADEAQATAEDLVQTVNLPEPPPAQTPHGPVKADVTSVSSTN